jgi:hypothetical protein
MHASSGAGRQPSRGPGPGWSIAETRKSRPGMENWRRAVGSRGARSAYSETIATPNFLSSQTIAKTSATQRLLRNAEGDALRENSARRIVFA